MLWVQRMAPTLMPAQSLSPRPAKEAKPVRAARGYAGPQQLPGVSEVGVQLNKPAISQPLILAFARSLLEHPEAAQPPVTADGGRLACYGGRHREEEEQTAITAGMVNVPDTAGRPTAYVADKQWFDETCPVELGRPVQIFAGTSTVTGIPILQI